MNPSSIKKIINKKVTLITINDCLPVEKCHSPINCFGYIKPEVLLIQIK